MGTVNEALATSISRLRALDEEVEQDSVDFCLAIIRSAYNTMDISIDLLEKAVSSMKAQRQKIITDDIPCILGEYGLAEATMGDGTKVSMDVAYESKQNDKALLAEWLEKSGYKSIIKDKFSFEKGAVDEELTAFLAEHGYSYSRDIDINANSLKATLKQHIESGLEKPPVEAVEVKPFSFARIKFPKNDF